MNLRGHSFIGDQLGKNRGASFQAVSPLDRAPLEPAFSLANEEDVNLALELAESAFDTCCASSGEHAGLSRERIADKILALGDGLIRRAHQETGLPEARLPGERARTCNQL